MLHRWAVPAQAADQRRPHRLLQPFDPLQHEPRPRQPLRDLRRFLNRRLIHGRPARASRSPTVSPMVTDGGTHFSIVGFIRQI